MKMSWATLVLILALAVTGGGCDARNAVTEEDRAVLSMSRQAAEIQEASVGALVAFVRGAAVPIPVTVEQLMGTLTQVNADQRENLEVLEENWGPPKAPVTYSSAAAKAARDASRKSHSQVGFWAGLGAVILTGLGLGWKILRSPLVKAIPIVGTYAHVADALVEGAERWMAREKREGRPDAADGLAEELARTQATRKLEGFVEPLLLAAKARLAKVLPPTVAGGPAGAPAVERPPGPAEAPAAPGGALAASAGPP